MESLVLMLFLFFCLVVDSIFFSGRGRFGHIKAYARSRCVYLEMTGVWPVIGGY